MRVHVNFLCFFARPCPQHSRNPRTPHIVVAILTVLYTPLRLIEDFPVFHFAKRMYAIELSQKYNH